MATATSAAKSSGASNGKSDRAEYVDIEEQLAKLSSDIATLTTIVADFGAGKIDEASLKAVETRDRIAARSVDALQRASRKVEATESDFEDQIRAHPLTAIGVAAGVGFLAALLTRR